MKTTNPTTAAIRNALPTAAALRQPGTQSVSAMMGCGGRDRDRRCAVRGGDCADPPEIFVIFLILGRVGVPYIFLGHKDTNTLLS